MLGRGVIANPQLIDMLRSGDTKADKERIKAFHDEVCSGYEEILSGDRNVLFKMKELWFYIGQIFEEDEKYRKEIKKCQSVSQYHIIVDEFFAEKEIIDGKGYKYF